jgi:hypothetical protein
MSSFDHSSGQMAKNIPVRGNVTSGMDRILNMPRAKIYRTLGITGWGPGSAEVDMDIIEYDTDGMVRNSATRNTPQWLVAKTAGVYIASANVEWQGGSGAAGFWNRIIINSVSTSFVAEMTDFRDTAPFGGFSTITGIWVAKAGDFISLWLNTTAATNAAVGQFAMHLTACMISTLP